MEKIGKILDWLERLLMSKMNEITGEIKSIHTHRWGGEGSREFEE